MNQFPLLPLLSTSLHKMTGWGRIHVSNQSLQTHAKAALCWIERAVDITNDGGISKGFDLLRGEWFPSYPETTGYTIPSLLNASQVYQDKNILDMAYNLANYELEQSTSDGGIAHWNPDGNAIPIVFDTGQVIFGWLACYLHNQDEQFLHAAIRSANWLCSIQDRTGAWKNNQYLGVPKVIDTRVSWALLELFEITQNETYRHAAIRNTCWAIEQQDSSGWFHQCAFRLEDDPYTHTLAYTTEGLLECGVLLDDSRLISAARKTADSMMHIQRSDGSLAGIYGKDWSHPSSWSCLTGNCQMARIWLRFYQFTGEAAYLDAGKKAILFVASIQDIKTKNANLYGGIPGSQPLWGAYERFKLPNWAAKFFIDAILQLEEIESEVQVIIYSG